MCTAVNIRGLNLSSCGFPADYVFDMICIAMPKLKMSHISQKKLIASRGRALVSSETLLFHLSSSSLRCLICLSSCFLQCCSLTVVDY